MRVRLGRWLPGHDCRDTTDDLVHQRFRNNLEASPVARLKIEGARLVATDEANRSGTGISQ